MKFIKIQIRFKKDNFLRFIKGVSTAENEIWSLW